MTYLIYILLILFCCWVVSKINFVKNSGLTQKQIISLFLITVLSSVLYGFFSLLWYGPDSDCWDFNRQGIIENKWLLENPKAFIIDLIGDRYNNGYSGLFSSSNSFWNDFNDNLIIKLVAVFNFLSRGFYYCNVLPFTFISFLGHVALYRLFSKIYQNKKLVIIGTFFLPSTLIFTAAIGKDAVAFFSLSVLVFILYQIIQNKNKKPRYIITASIFYIIFFLFKIHFALLLLPAILAWIFATKLKKHSWLSFVATYFICVLLFFTIHKIIPSTNPMHLICNSQASFALLPKGKTDVQLNILEPTFKSFLSNSPQALSHTFLRPYVGEIMNKSLVPAALELFLYHLAFILFIIYRKKNILMISNSTIVIFLLSYVTSCLLLTGYITANLNSIFRYRCIFWPLIITPILCSIEFSKIPLLNKLMKNII